MSPFDYTRKSFQAYNAITTMVSNGTELCGSQITRQRAAGLNLATLDSGRLGARFFKYW